jgi:P-type Ca2+ transporter type 2C
MIWHRATVEQLSQEFDTDLQAGLPESDAKLRLTREGPNELPQAPSVSALQLFVAQFVSVIVWVLIGAAIVAGLLEEWVDAILIVAIVVLNAMLGFVQEFRAGRSLDALKRMEIATARVIRDGQMQSIPARKLIPGDIIQIEAGDRVPADARLIYAAALQTQEASLTGESTPVSKTSEVLDQDKLPLGDRRNMMYMGTTATSGKGRACVVTTGIRTELGRIAAMIHEAGEAKQLETPLQRRLDQLGHTLLWLSLAIVVIIFLIGNLRGIPMFAMFLTSVSLAVAAIPEGLPAVVTITLALGVTRMVKRHALIRRLPAVETLGSTTVICTDKTGTLTKNEMTVTRLFLDGQRYDVTGEGYAPTGDIQQAIDGSSPDSGQVLSRSPLSAAEEEALQDLLMASVLCNGAELTSTEEGWNIIGDPTEGALLVVAAKAGLEKEALEAQAPLVGEIPFDPERKMMTIVRNNQKAWVAYTKGAPDVLLDRCSRFLTIGGAEHPLDQSARATILEANGRFAQEALRILGVAKRTLPDMPKEFQPDGIEQDLTFLGLLAMKDPLRSEAVTAVQTCRDAGIRTVMITGDHKDTAMAIGRDLGILEKGKQALSGTELNRLSDTELNQQVEQTAVYARVSAEHKLRVVRAWKNQGAVVAMTGDGVNDAPAIQEADIGIAMGITGTAVTKEASAMVVTDDNFASIAAAVEEGRGIYANIVKAVHFLLSCNISEVLLMLFAVILGLPLPLLPVQILWINLVTNGLPALTFAVEPSDPDTMRRPPRNPKGRILEQGRLIVMFVQGLFIALVTTLSFVYCLYGMDQDLDRARTLTLTILVFAHLAHAFNCRSDNRSIFALGFLTNKALLFGVMASVGLQAGIIFSHPIREIFKVTPFDPQHWLLALGIGLLPLLAMELWKATKGNHHDGEGTKKSADLSIRTA